MGKGDDTRNAILDAALQLASRLGVEGLTIGALARRAGLSKSGLYAHFEGREDLQCAMLDAAVDRFVEQVLRPATRAPRGLPRVLVLFDRWVDWQTNRLDGGCVFMSAASEFDDRPGPVRERVVKHVNDLMANIARAATIARDEGHLSADLDAEQFAFEFWACLLAHQQFARLLDDPQARQRATRQLHATLTRFGATL